MPAFAVTLVGLTLLSGMATTTGVTLLVLPALFITVPGDTLSAAAGELLAGRLTAGAVRLAYGLFVLGLIVVGLVAAAQVADRHRGRGCRPGVFANLLAAGPGHPPRLVLLLGGFFVLTVGGLGVRGFAAVFGGDVESSVRDLVDFGLQIPTVAFAIALGVVVSDGLSRWLTVRARSSAAGEADSTGAP